MGLLGSLIDELYDIAVHAPVGGPAAEQFLAAEHFLELPRYLAVPKTAAAERLKDDLDDVISRDLEPIDAFFATLLFRYQDIQEGIVERAGEIAKRLRLKGQKANERSVRGERRIAVLAEIAHAMWMIGTGTHPRQRHASGLGYRVIRQDWSVTQYESPPVRELYRFHTTLEAVQPNQRFVIYGQELYGSNITRADTEDASQKYVGYCPADQANPGGTVLHVVYFGREMTIGREEAVTLIVDTESPPDSEGSALEIFIAQPTQHISLKAYIPASMPGTHYTRQETVRPAGYRPPKDPQRVKRKVDEPLVYEIPDPIEGHKYEIAWDDR